MGGGINGRLIRKGRRCYLLDRTGGQTDMKPRLATVSALAALAIGGSALSQTADSQPKDGNAMTRIHVVVGDETLAATLDDTATARDFAAMLPLDLTLSDYHGIEKIADLPRRLDTTGAPESYKPETGEITLYAPWGNLAIFYKPFQRSRGLVRLGAFDGPLDALLRDGDFTVTIQRAD